MNSSLNTLDSLTELLGIQDLSQPDYGDPVKECPGDVPVFWACGVTGVEAVQSCSKVSPKTVEMFLHCLVLLVE